MCKIDQRKARHSVVLKQYEYSVVYCANHGSKLRLHEELMLVALTVIGLLQPVPEGDYDALVAVMGYLMNVKERAVTTDDMFQPLTETIELLKFYDMDIPEEVNVLLQVN